MKHIGDEMKRILSDTSPGRMQTSSTPNQDGGPCHICGKESICMGLGMIRYEVPVEDERFGKLYRCPNNPAAEDQAWRDRIREFGNFTSLSDKTFDNFQIDLPTYPASANESLVRSANAAFHFAERLEGWLLLEGDYGTGKTHLAAAVGNYRLEQGDAVLFITVPDLLDHLRSAYGPSSEMGYDETFNRVRSAQLLVLDDLGVENPSPWAQEKLFQLLNHRYIRRLPTVVTTNVDIDDLDQRIRSRILDNTLTRRIKIAAPDYRAPIDSVHTRLKSQLHMHQEMSFEDFDIRAYATEQEQENLSRALHVARRYAENPRGWLLLAGGPGTGKTHLAVAIGEYRHALRDQVMFLSASELLDYLRETFGRATKTSFNERLEGIKEVSVLILDSLPTDYKSEWSQEKLFQILDYRYVNRLPTVITIAGRVEEFPLRLRTRLLDDRVCHIFGLRVPSYTMRRQRR